MFLYFFIFYFLFFFFNDTATTEIYTLSLHDALPICKSYTLDLGAIAYLRDKMWGGITYRLEESANFLIGYNLLKDNALKVGYSFEYVIQNREAKQADRKSTRLNSSH